MNPFWFVILVVAHWASAPAPITVQFGQSAVGREVTVCLDGQKVETTFAGKLSFRDEAHGWQSVCADVRSPVSQGQYFNVRPLSSKDCGGNIRKAGNIVAKFFKAAQTPDQCAALQIAVWKTIEDGPNSDFASGNFQVSTSAAVMALAQQYYQGSGEEGDAVYLQTQGGTGQSQMSPV